MPLKPNDYDAAAGYTETLTAVAVLHHGEEGDLGIEVPWIDIGSAGIGIPAEVWRWLDHDVPWWDDHDVNCAAYIVPEDDYRPLRELGVRSATELDCMDFLATLEDVATVREATANRGQEGDDPPPADSGGGTSLRSLHGQP